MAYLLNKNTKQAVITGYKPFYIQKASSAYDTKSEWGLVAKTNPYPVLPTPKAPYSNDWLDENGLDEYNEHLYYESMDMEVSFYAKAIDATGKSAAAQLREWLDDLMKIIGQGEFRVFDSYTSLGFRKVRYDGTTNTEYKSRGNWASVVLTIKLKVNDPVTRLDLVGGNIVPTLNGRSNSSAATQNKTVYVDGFSLREGAQIAVSFAYANTNASPALNVSSTGARAITHIPSGGLKANVYYFFEYNGTSWECKGLL